MKKYQILVFVLFLFLFFIGCSEDSDKNMEQSEESISLSTNIKNSSVFYDLDSKTETILPDLIIEKISSGFASYPIFKIYKDKIGETTIKIVRTDKIDLSEIGVDNLNSYSMIYDTLTGKDWYNYNPQTHTLSPKPNVYLLLNSQGNFVKFKVKNYSSSGELTFVFAIKYSDSTNFSKIDSLKIPLPSSYSYFSFQKGILNEIKDWDLKFAIIKVQTPIGLMNYPGIILNSTKGVFAAFKDNVDYNNLNPSDYEGSLRYDSDTSYVIGTNCFKYDENSHKLSPYDNRVFIVKSTERKIYKIRMKSYYNSLGKSGYISFEYK